MYFSVLEAGAIERDVLIRVAKQTLESLELKRGQLVARGALDWLDLIEVTTAELATLCSSFQESRRRYSVPLVLATAARRHNDR